MGGLLSTYSTPMRNGVVMNFHSFFICFLFVVGFDPRPAFKCGRFLVLCIGTKRNLLLRLRRAAPT
jgi:high-affinity nickel permease